MSSAPTAWPAGRDCSSNLRHAADRGQRFAAKAERADAEEIVGVVQFAGGVAGKGQRQIVGVDAAAVVDDANQFDAALLDFDIDARAAGVNGVFEQFLDDAGRPLDDLASGDLGDDVGRKLANSRHEFYRRIKPRNTRKIRKRRIQFDVIGRIFRAFRVVRGLILLFLFV